MISPWKNKIDIIPLEKVQLSKLSLQRKKLMNTWKQFAVINVLENELLSTD